MRLRGRASEIVASWPKWKRDVTLTKYCEESKAMSERTLANKIQYWAGPGDIGPGPIRIQQWATEANHLAKKLEQLQKENAELKAKLRIAVDLLDFELQTEYVDRLERYLDITPEGGA